MPVSVCLSSIILRGILKISRIPVVVQIFLSLENRPMSMFDCNMLNFRLYYWYFLRCSTVQTEIMLVFSIALVYTRSLMLDSLLFICYKNKYGIHLRAIHNVFCCYFMKVLKNWHMKENEKYPFRITNTFGTKLIMLL